MMRRALLLFALLVPAFANAATGGKLPGEEIVGRADDEDPKAFVKRVKSDLVKVDASIDATKTLLAKSKDSLLLPDISLRLAELYVEKSRLLYYKAVEERATKSGEAVAAPDAKYFKELAIELYKKILKDFPAYPQNDKIRFYLGHEYQELALTPEMLKEYSRLATDYPDSPLVPEALLIQGNFYFEKRDMDTAEKHYKKVLEKNDKGLAALARYKMGWIEMNRTNHKEALANFEQAARYANAGTMAATNASTAQRQKLKNVRREALTDSVQPFTEVKKPEDAVAYYGELADTRNLDAAILEKLGNRDYIQQNWDPSAKIYRTLVTLTHDVERSYEFGQRFFECVVKARAEFEKKPTKQEKALGATDPKATPTPAVSAVVTPIPSPAPGATPAPKKLPMPFVAEDAQMLTDTIARYSSSWRIPKKDRDAALKEYELFVRDIATRLQIASQNEQNPTKKKQMSWEAARAYKSYLSFFKEPTQKKAMEENYALALTFSGRHWEAGRQWEDVAKLDKKTERDAIHDALAEYHEANKERDKIGRFRRVQAREGEKMLGEYYAQVYPDGEDSDQIEFNVGRVYYEEGDYESAIQIFRQYVKEHPGSKEAYAAANLILDSYVQMENFEALSGAAKAMQNDPSLPDPKFRAQVAEIAKQADFRRVGTLLAEGGDGDEDPTDRLARLAEESKGNELGEKALYTLFITSRDRGEPAKIYETGERFLATYPKSEFSSEVLQSIGRLAIDSADFARAASYYETYAKTRPGDKASPTLLERAAQIREKMGDPARAAANYMALSKFPGQLPPKEAALRAVMAFRTVGDWPKAAEASRRLIQAGGDGPLARYTIAQALQRSGRADEAKKEYLEAAQKGLAGQTPTSEDRDAAAHSAFIIAEDMRKQFEAVPLNDAATLQDALAKKLGLLRELEAMETEVVKIGSGEWAIAGLYRVGEGYKRLADAIRKAPVPPEMASPAQKIEYATMVESQLAGPLDETAKQSFKACIDKANELKVISPFVAGCASSAAREPVMPGDPPPPKGGRARPPADLTAQLAKDPLNAGLLTRIANGYLSGGDPYTAELISRRAIEVDDSASEAHTILAFALLRRGEVAEAHDAFEAAAERAPGQPKEWLNLAAHQYAYGDPRKAVESLKRAQNPRSVNLSASDVHPAARKLMTDAARLMSMK